MHRARRLCWGLVGRMRRVDANYVGNDANWLGSSPREFA
jgi:hypothetical protein